MTTLIPKFDLKDGGSTPVGAVNRPINEKLAETVSVKDFGAVGDGVVDDTASIQAALNASSVVYIPEGIYKVTDKLNATTDHQISGDGFGVTVINSTYTDDSTISVPAPVTDVYAALRFENFTINAKYGIHVGGDENSHATDGAIIGPYFNVQVVGTYGSGSGDANFSTANVMNGSGVAVSSISSTAMNALYTWYNLYTFGTGIFLSKCIDTTIEAPQFYGNGVSLALIGCDLTRWNGGRAHEVGIFMYDQRVGTWGSQNVMSDVDMLQNRRAGGLLLNNTKFSGAVSGYYECYHNSALFMYAESTEGVNWFDTRIDDTYFGTSQTTPLGLFVNAYWSNKISDLRYQKFTLFTVPIPSIRVVTSAASTAADTNHPELIALVPRSGYVPIRYTSMEIGCRYGDLNPTLYTPNNVPDVMGGNSNPLAGDVSGTDAFYWASSSATITARFNIQQILTGYTFNVRGRVLSGTTIFFTIEHKSFDGTTKSTLFSGTVGGFNTSTFSTQTQALALTANVVDGDYILVSWTAGSAYIAGLQLT
jgi:fluoride ion exporter CrcB/FEX